MSQPKIRQFHDTFFATDLMYILYDIAHNRPFWGACRASWCGSTTQGICEGEK